MRSLSSWLHTSDRQTHKRAERRSAPGLAAYHRSGPNLMLDKIKDISSTGMYLLTQERWLPGEVVSLTLQKEGPPERNSARRAAVQARAVRWGSDGIGMSFILPEDANFDLWGSPLNSMADQPEPEDILREFRIAEALAFLNRLCPPAADELSVLFRKGLGNCRVESAVEIALKAEKSVMFRSDADSLRVPSSIVTRVFDYGSWSDDDRVRQFWAGLLIASCTDKGGNESYLNLVEPLSQLTTVHVRILAAACERARLFLSDNGSISAEPQNCHMDEVVKIAGSRDISKVDRDLGHLYLVGLLEKRTRGAALLPIDEANITPTSFGLELYARCNGHHGALQDFYNVASDRAAETSGQ